MKNDMKKEVDGRIRRDQDRAEKISRMQALVDEAVASGEGERSMEQIEQEAQARLSARK